MEQTEDKNTNRKSAGIKKENCAPFSDFIKIVSHKAKLSPKTVQKVYNAMLDYIVEELQLREAVYLRGLGYIGAIPVGGYDKLMPETFGSTNMVYKYVPPQYRISYKPTPTFIEKVNTPIGNKKDKKKKSKPKPHKYGMLIENNSDLKEQRRAIVKTLIRDEGRKHNDPEYAAECENDIMTLSVLEEEMLEDKDLD